ncbi:M48 family metalloprotease [Candidatus Uhrbacteria bacterium]|nr:M48 family metalloprotease [Candidatus Uhrbacteria bacterium]
MGKLFFASTVTLGLLFSFVFFVVILALLVIDAVSLGFAIALTVAINVLLWLIGPWFTDFINRWLYKVRFLKKEEFESQHPAVATLIADIAKEHKFKFPKIGIISDQNPTAFTYGSGRYNCRIILTEGIFHFLNDDEARAVVAHEMGHIVHRDFIVMMVASTLIQILYEIYAWLIRVRSSGDKDNKGAGVVKLIAIVSYVLYWIGVYLLLYLSRTREYLADTFSSKHVESRHLADALIKIAYGIVTADDSDSAKRLLQSTRHLGIMDVKNAKSVGTISYITHEDQSVIAEALVFDKVNPWAKLIELNSTHPLTGKRIEHLQKLAGQKGDTFPLDVKSALAKLSIDHGRLNKDFVGGLLILALPWIAGISALFLLPLELVLGAIGAGLLLQVWYKFPYATPQETTILDELRNPYASPLRGKPIALSGAVIGRGVPGYVFGEDMMYQDKTGIIFLDFTHVFGFLGNIFFALKKVKNLFSVPSQAYGWFYRGMGAHVSLQRLATEKEIVKSHPVAWALVLPIILIGASIIWFLSNNGGI